MQFNTNNLSSRKSIMVVVGIDLGTTNTGTATIKRGKAEILTSREGKHGTPSAITNGKVRKSWYSTWAEEL